MLSDLRHKLERHARTEGLSETAIPSVGIYMSTHAEATIHSLLKPSLCLTIQGSKDVVSEDQVLTYAEGEFIFTSIDLPVCGRVKRASQERPYLSLVLAIEQADVLGVLEHVSLPSVDTSAPSRAIFVGKTDDATDDAFRRLVALLDKPEDIAFLYPLIIREILYRLIAGAHGNTLVQMSMSGSKTRNIARAVKYISGNLSEKLDIGTMARLSGMSTSNFHKYFKNVTGLTPLAYQKKIRLLEARRLLVSNACDAATAGYQVGFESSSHFSREYSKLFGLPPKTDLKAMAVEAVV